MTNISNPFSRDCRQLPQKYTISTLYSANIADNQDSYGYILKFTRFTLSIHNKGIRHKDYNPGNILVHFPNGKARPIFTLIDINQMAIGRKPGIKKSVISFMQNRMRMKEEILPMVRYYSNLRKIPYRLCRMACFRYYILREVQRFLKKPVKALVLAVAR